MRCYKCEGYDFCKNGYALGRQRYKCKRCGRNQTQNRPQGYSDRDKAMAVVLYLHRMSMRSIAKIIGCSVQSVMVWIRVHGDSLKPNDLPDKPVELEIDEMWHYLKKSLPKSGSGRCIAVPLKDSSPGFLVIVQPQA